MTNFDEVWLKNSWEAQVTLNTLLAAIPATIGVPSAFIPQGVLKNVHQAVFGGRKWITAADADKVTTPQLLWESVTSSLRSLSSLPKSLAQLLQSEVLLSDTDRASWVLRDIGLDFDELSKRSASELRSMFEMGGLLSDDAENLALAVYTKKRRMRSNEAPQLNRLEAAMEALTANDENVSLSYCSLDANGLANVQQTISGDNNLRQLDLSGNNVHARGSEIVAEFLVNLCELRSLNLTGNTLLRQGCENVINSAVANLKHLTNLNLSGCFGGPKLLDSLAPLVGVPTLTSLNLSANDLGVLKRLPHLPYLTSLDLSSNRLHNDAAAALRDAVQAPVLSELILANNFIDKDGATLVAAFVEERSYVRLLSLAFNPLGDLGAHAFAPLIQRGVLFHFDAAGSRASPDVLHALQQACSEADASRKSRLSELRQTRIEEWSVGDVEQVLDDCVTDALCRAKLHGKSGLQLCEGGFGCLNLSDWCRLQQFQGK